jgi:hypothetical protein
MMDGRSSPPVSWDYRPGKTVLVPPTSGNLYSVLSRPPLGIEDWFAIAKTSGTPMIQKIQMGRKKCMVTPEKNLKM